MFKNILSCFVLGLPLWVACTASASDFPNRPIKLLVGSPPGASTDTYARIIGEALGRSLGQSVMIENRTGASGIIATMQELGIKDYEFLNWFGVVAPSKTPREIVEKINRALVDLLKQTDVHQRLTSDGSVLVGGTPAEFDAFLADDILKSGKLANAIGLKKN